MRKSFPSYGGMVAAAALASTVSSFIDGCITGKCLGSQSMAAFGVAMPFVLLLIVVPGMIISSGGSICASRYIGVGQKERADSNYTACCIFGICIGLAAMIICIAFAPALISITGSEGFIASEAVNYMKGFGLGAVPTMMLMILMAYANVDGNEKSAFAAVALMTAADIVLDVLLGVVLDMGLFGMALATALGYVIAVLYFLLAFFRGKSTFRIRTANSLRELGSTLQFGYPTALNTLLVSGRCFFINMILLALAGGEAVSAFSFQSNFNQFFVAVAGGVGTAISVLVGVFVGESDRKKILSSAGTGLEVGVAASVVIGAVLYIFAPQLTDLLMSDMGKTISYSVQALRLYSISLPLSVICIVLISYYQTLGDRIMANCIAIGHGLVFPLLFAVVLGRFFGTNGVWISTAAAEATMILLILAYSRIRSRSAAGTGVSLLVLEDKYCRHIEPQFLMQGPLSEESIGTMQKQLLEFLNDSGISGEFMSVCGSAVDILSSEINNGGPESRSREILDIQGFIRNGEAVINIRVSGEQAHIRVREKGAAINAALPECCTFSSHCSAGISFMNLHCSLS